MIMKTKTEKRRAIEKKIGAIMMIVSGALMLPLILIALPFMLLFELAIGDQF